MRLSSATYHLWLVWWMYAWKGMIILVQKSVTCILSGGAGGGCFGLWHTFIREGSAMCNSLWQRVGEEVKFGQKNLTYFLMAPKWHHAEVIIAVLVAMSLIGEFFLLNLLRSYSSELFHQIMLRCWFCKKLYLAIISNTLQCRNCLQHNARVVYDS